MFCCCYGRGDNEEEDDEDDGDEDDVWAYVEERSSEEWIRKDILARRVR